MPPPRGLRETALTTNGRIVPGAIVQYSVGLTLPQAIEHGEQISKLARENKASGLSLIAELVKNLANFFKTKRALENEDDYFEVAALIMEEHKFMKVEEIAYVFKQAKLGKIGKVLDRLDGATIMGFIREFEKGEERIGYFEKRSRAPVDKFEVLGFLADNSEKLGVDISQIGKEKEKQEEEYRRFRQQYIATKEEPTAENNPDTES